MSQLTIEQAFQIGLQHHRAGRLAEAEILYEQIVAQRPEHFGSLHHLGLIAQETGRHSAAVILLRKAIALEPNSPDTLNALGNALEDDRKIDAAIAAYRQAIAINPKFTGAYNNLGIALKNAGRPDEAIAAYCRAIEVEPRYPLAHFNLGIVLTEKGRIDQAIAAFGQAINFKPDYPEANDALGNALVANGRLNDAIAAYRQAIILKPNYAQAHSNLAHALWKVNQPDAAIAAARRAIALNPNYPEAFNNLGSALGDAGQLDQAIAAYRHALSLRPGYVDAHDNLLFALHFHPASDAQSMAREHRRWNDRHAEPLKHLIQPFLHDRDPHRRLKVGYVSADFRRHPVGRFMLPLLENHDKTQFEIFAYSQSSLVDPLTERLKSHIDSWRSIVSLSDEQAADLIRRDQIDVLVDLSMHSSGNRLLLFACKPAPVQVTYLAYCSGTGLHTVDYRLSDHYLDPPGQDPSIYSERTICLPDTYWCYPPSVAACDVNPPPASGEGFITFGSLNNFSKVSTPALETWAELLRAVPTGRLLLHAHEGTHRQTALDQFGRLGVESARITFTGRVSVQEYFKLYNRIDIALDPFPYGGGTTTCDALWMGVPVITLAGKTAVGRGGVSILSNIGLPEFVARSQEEYIQLASGLARDLPRLKNLRGTLRQKMEQSPLMNAVRFAREVEAAYRQMWHNFVGA